MWFWAARIWNFTCAVILISVALKAALEAGAQSVGERGKLIAAEVISRPHEDLLRLLPA
jgi:microcompartment protein CcmL/EutN